jgi:plastocyanin
VHRIRARSAGALGGLLLLVTGGLTPGWALAQGYPWPGGYPGYGDSAGPGGVPGFGGFPVPGGFPGPGGLPGFGGYPGVGGFPGYGAYPGYGGYPSPGGMVGPGGVPGFGPGGGYPGAGAYPSASGSGGSTVATTPTQSVRMTINDFYFRPAEISFPAGTQITWVNRGQTQHTTTSVTRGQWDSDSINPGGSWAAVFSVPGTYEYNCTFHPDEMRARLTITAS